MARMPMVAAVVAVAFLGGCATSVHKQTSELKHTQATPQILLMPLDVELSELSAGGVAEPKADWTAAAKQNMMPALNAEQEARHVQFIEYGQSASNEPTTLDADAQLQIIKLHRAVGQAILIHQYTPGFELPTKEGKFDWSLGPAAHALRAGNEADYALFIYVRDSYTSAGRAAVVFLAAALFGVHMPAGTQLGFASLVDLQTGNIVWFNRLLRQSGDLRTPEPAAETIKTLLTGFPS